MSFIVSIGLGALWIGMTGLAVSTLWGWFVVPTFGLPALSWNVAAGIALILHISSLSYSSFRRAPEAPTPRELAMGDVFAVGVPGIAMLFGWVLSGL